MFFSYNYIVLFKKHSFLLKINIFLYNQYIVFFIQILVKWSLIFELKKNSGENEKFILCKLKF